MKFKNKLIQISFEQENNKDVDFIELETYNKLMELKKKLNVSLDSVLYVLCNKELKQLKRSVTTKE